MIIIHSCLMAQSGLHDDFNNVTILTKNNKYIIMNNDHIILEDRDLFTCIPPAKHRTLAYSGQYLSIMLSDIVTQWLKNNNDYIRKKYHIM